MSPKQVAKCSLGYPQRDWPIPEIPWVRREESARSMGGAPCARAAGLKESMSSDSEKLCGRRYPNKKPTSANVPTASLCES